MRPPPRFQLVSPPPTGRSAIAVIHLWGDVSRVFERLGAAPLADGAVGVRSLGGIDKGVVARWSASAAMLMPHASPPIVAELLNRLVGLGCEPITAPDPTLLYPEAADAIEARMLLALSRAASPLAIDLLLAQPGRWRAADLDAANDPGVLARSRVLDRLIDPPTVVAIGRPNIGKSTLLNALAGRGAAVVADVPGTTRDHVGVTLDLAGLVVRWIDTPGLETPSADTDPIQAEAQALARHLAAAADLIVLCADATGPPPPHPQGPMVLRAGLRADLGPAAEPVLVELAAGEGRGVPELVAAIREALVPAAFLADQGPWKFWA